MDPFVSEVRIFGFNWAPKGWAFCNGALLPVKQNAALFALIGTHFGGDGVTSFALPDLRGRTPVSFGSTTERNSPSFVTGSVGQAGGAETVTLSTAQIPQHNHMVTASTLPGSVKPLLGNIIGAGKNLQNNQPSPVYASFAANQQVNLPADVIADTGGGQPHNNCQPSLPVNYCIAIQGLFPSRN